MNKQDMPTYKWNFTFLDANLVHESISASVFSPAERYKILALQKFKNRGGK
jgi:hypothetical protein